MLLTTCPNMSSRNFHNAVEIFDGSGCEAAEALCTNLQLVSQIHLVALEGSGESETSLRSPLPFPA